MFTQPRGVVRRPGRAALRPWLRCLLAVGALAPLAGCGDGETPEARIRAAIAAMETAVESREPGGFLEHVTDDFSGQHGNLDRSTLRGYLAGLLVGNEMIEVTLAPATVTLHGADRATVEVSALVIGGARLPERGEHLSIESGWRLDDGEWKVYAAEWK